MIVNYYNARILQNHQIVKGELWVQDGKIIKPKKTADIKVNVKGHLIAPGFIDMQVMTEVGSRSRHPARCHCCDFPSASQIRCDIVFANSHKLAKRRLS